MRRSPSKASWANKLLWLTIGFMLLVVAAAHAQNTPGRAFVPASGDPSSAPSTADPGGAADAPPANASAAASGVPAPTAGEPTEGPAAGGGEQQPEVRLPPTEAEEARGFAVSAIDVVGNRRITATDIVGYLHLGVGKAFSPEALQGDIRSLWTTGFFEDIQVELDRTGGTLRLRFVVKERPTIAKIEFEGLKAIEEDDIKGAIEIKANDILSRPAIRRSVQRIRDMYAEKGYFLAEVQPEVVPLKHNEVRIVFRVDEHAEVSVRRVSFIGNEEISSEELRSIMFTGQGSFFTFGSGGPFRQDAFERDIAMISGMYYDRGYLSVKVSTPRVMLTPDRDGIEVSITIDEGPRYRVRQLRVYQKGADGREVDPIPGRRELRSMVRLEPGDYFNRSALMEDLQRVQTLYRDLGYALAEAPPQTQVDEAKREVDVIVPVTPGELFRFGRIEIAGNSKTRDKVMRREMEVEENELFHETNLDRSRRRLMALGFFERVDVSTKQGKRPNTMDVTFEVVEKSTGTFQIGVGFSSIETFIATAQVQQQNLFGNGQSLSAQAQISGIRRDVSVSFVEPYFLDSLFSSSVELFDTQRYYTDFSNRSQGGSVSFGYPIIRPEFSGAITYRGALENVTTATQSTFFGASSSVSVFRELPLANLFNDGFTSSIRPSLTYDGRDNRIQPTSGVYGSGSMEFATPYLGSENDFIRTSFTGRIYYPVKWGIVAKLNSETIHIISPTEDGVPIYHRSYLGGINDLRGFRYRTIGPRIPLTYQTDPNSRPIYGGANIGGNLSYFQNLELEFPIVESVGVKGVLFTDLGNAWNLEGNYCDAARGYPIPGVRSPCFEFPYSLGKLRTSWGFGLRWFSPMGPLRFEWGFPFKPLQDEESNVFEFTIGNFF